MKKKHKGGKMGGKKHTGPISNHADQTSYLDGHGGKDPHMDAAHHAANCEHGMEEGMSPMGSYDGGGEGPGEAIGDNASME